MGVRARMSVLGCVCVFVKNGSVTGFPTAK